MPVDPSALYGGYLRASRYGRTKDSDLEAALKPYKITLARVRTPKKKASDAALRSMATKAVVKKYQKNKKSS